MCWTVPHPSSPGAWSDAYSATGCTPLRLPSWGALYIWTGQLTNVIMHWRSEGAPVDPWCIPISEGWIKVSTKMWQCRVDPLSHPLVQNWPTTPYSEWIINSTVLWLTNGLNVQGLMGLNMNGPRFEWRCGKDGGPLTVASLLILPLLL